jgi:hypothetical protein
VALVVPCGPESMLVCGSVVSGGSSTVQVRLAAAPVLPAPSVALTETVWSPRARSV